jgi:KaiC/GvpD/RAD55 family RecA-like ATPase
LIRMLMPKLNKRVHEAMETAMRHEGEFNWLEAAKSYAQLLDSETASDITRGETWERTAFCYRRASTQVEDAEDFKALRQQAAEAYTRAADYFDEEDGVANQGRSAYCRAMASYARSWLATTPSKRKADLDECRSLLKKSMEMHRKAGDESSYGKICGDLLTCLHERLCLASDLKEMEEISLEGLEQAETCIETLSKLNDKAELLRVYSMACLNSWYAHGSMPDLEGLVERSLKYSGKALSLSEEIDNPYYTALSHWAAALCKLLFTEDAQSALSHGKKMLEYAATARDFYLRGVAYYVLAFVTNWLAIREANPDNRRKGHEETVKYAKEAVRYLEPICQDFFIAETCLFYAEAYSSLASDFATNSVEKNVMLEKAIEIGRKGLEHATKSGSPDALGSTLHALSKALHLYSNLKTVANIKARLIEEALDYREKYIGVVEKAFPANDWIRSVGKNYEGLLKADLAKIDTSKDRKVAILRDAVLDMDDGVKRGKNWIATRPLPTLLVAVARFEDGFGGLLDKLWSLTHENDLLTKASEVYDDAAQNYQQAKLSSRAAESYWKKAQIEDRSGNNVQAAKDFEDASAMYETSAQSIPQFADFFQDYAMYMKAWSEIEKAKLAHGKTDYAAAVEHYTNSSNLLTQSKLWSYLSSNFLALAFLEKAEDFSRKENSRESLEAFQKSIDVFSESRGFLRVELGGIEKSDERDLVERLMRASEMRTKYCRGRMFLEEARILDRKGDHTASSEKYGSAAKTFQDVMETESEQTRRELKPLVFLSQAWQKMMAAEARAAPTMYGEAAELFTQAKEYAVDQSTSLFALANGSFCKALEAGTEFEITRDRESYLTAKRHMEAAADYYLKAGFKTASAYAEATRRLFDAYVYMDSAKRETDPEKEAKFYVMAEKVLQSSAGSFTVAKHPEKTEQVQQLLLRVRKDRELALSLSEVLHAPALASSTESFVTLTPSEEKAAGLERFEQADVQAKLITRVKEAKVGDKVSFELQVVNVGREAILLNRVEKIVPEGFEPVATPDHSQFEDSNLMVKGKRLEPLRLEELAFTLRPLQKGSFQIIPKVICVDQRGDQVDRLTQPVSIEVSEATLPGRVTTGYGDLDRLLLGGLPERYAVVLSSPSCDERDLLVRRFLEAGAKEGQVTFYVTIEPRGVMDLAEKYPSSFYLFICNPRADAMVGNQPNVCKLRGVENLTDISIALTSAYRKLDSSENTPRRVCIEVVSDVLLQHHAVITRKWLAGLIPDLRSAGFNTLAVINPMMHTTEEVHAVVGLFEGEIHIYQKETGRGPQKFLKVEKLYDKKYLDNELPLKRERLET